MIKNGNIAYEFVRPINFYKKYNCHIKDVFNTKNLEYKNNYYFISEDNLYISNCTPLNRRMQPFRAFVAQFREKDPPLWPEYDR